MSVKHKGVVVGATGGVGRFIVKTLALDPRVESVTAVVRKPHENLKEFYLLSDAPGGEEAAGKIKEEQIDFEKISDEPTKPGIFAGHTIGFSGLAVYTGHVRSEEEFRHIEVTTNLRAAKLMKLGGVESYAYLSSESVSQDPPKFYTPMFSRVKGEAERKLQHDVGFKRATIARPTGIFDRPKDSTTANSLEYFMNYYGRFLLSTHYGILAEPLLKRWFIQRLQRRTRPFGQLLI